MQNRFSTVCISTALLGAVLIAYLGAYLVMFLEHLEVIFSTHRRRAFGTSLRLPVVLATSTIFALVTSVCINSRCIWEFSHSPAPSPNIPVPQHEIIDGVRLYFAFQGSRTDGSPDEYYSNVTSALSLMKTSVYLIETAASDLFLVSPSDNFLSTCDAYLVAPSAIPLLPCMGGKCCHPSIPSASVCCGSR